MPCNQILYSVLKALGDMVPEASISHSKSPALGWGCGTSWQSQFLQRSWPYITFNPCSDCLIFITNFYLTTFHVLGQSLNSIFSRKTFWDILLFRACDYSPLPNLPKEVSRFFPNTTCVSIFFLTSLFPFHCLPPPLQCKKQEGRDLYCFTFCWNGPFLAHPIDCVLLSFIYQK